MNDSERDAIRAAFSYMGPETQKGLTLEALAKGAGILIKNAQAESAKLRADMVAELEDHKESLDMYRRARERAETLALQVAVLQKKLDNILKAVCKECSGSGEIGLADGEVSCPECGGSGDPLKPGIWAKKIAPAPKELPPHSCSIPGCQDE